MELSTSPRVRALFATQITCLVIVWIVMSIRVGVKLILKRQRTWDDTWMFIAAVLFTAMSILIIRGIVLGGIGQDASQITLQKVAIGLQTWYFGEIIYGLLSICIRISITIFLFKLLTESTHKRVLAACLAVVFATTLCFLVTTIFQCTPISYYWGRFSTYDGHGRCSHSLIVRSTAIAYSFVAAISDWLMTLLPVTCLWRARIPTAAKVTATGLISLGILAGIALIIRIPQIKSVALNEDFLYASINLAILSILEPCLGVLGGSAANLGLMCRISASRQARRPSSSPVRLPLREGTTTTVRGGRGHSADFGPPMEGIGVSSRVICTREELVQDPLDYHEFWRQSHDRSQVRQCHIPGEWSMFTFGLFEHLIYLLTALEPYLSPDANPMMKGMIFEIIRFLALDPIDVVVGVIYLQRLLFAMPGTPTGLSCYNKPLVFLTSLNIAHKFVSDFSYARAHHFSSMLRSLNCLQHHLNSCERSFVGIINWDLTVSEIQINTLNATFKNAPDPRSRIWYLTHTNYEPPPLTRADARAGEEFNQNLTTSNVRPQTSDNYEQGNN